MNTEVNEVLDELLGIVKEYRVRESTRNSFVCYTIQMREDLMLDSGFLLPHNIVLSEDKATAKIITETLEERVCKVYDLDEDYSPGFYKSLEESTKAIEVEEVTEETN